MRLTVDQFAQRLFLYNLACVNHSRRLSNGSPQMPQGAMCSRARKKFSAACDGSFADYVPFIAGKNLNQILGHDVFLSSFPECCRDQAFIAHLAEEFIRAATA
jgi:hypothetical protein